MYSIRKGKIIMDHKEIRELAALMNEMGLTSLEYKGGGESLRLQRGVVPVAVSASAPETVSRQEQRPNDSQPSGSGYMVKSPMVGVFYCAPGADKDPYVALGDTVHAGDVLCIIEAMKIMNEITAERDGVITEICAEDKQVIEFGQPLFRIDQELL